MFPKVDLSPQVSLPIVDGVPLYSIQVKLILRFSNTY